MNGMTALTSFQKVFETVDDIDDDDQPEITCWHQFLPCGGQITVVSRMTGFGWRDVETGYRSSCGKFWLASGQQDIRQFLETLNSFDEMTQWVIDRANNCVSLPPRDGYVHSPYIQKIVSENYQEYWD